jgi:DNA-binding transcriptional regulator YbjK
MSVDELLKAVDHLSETDVDNLLDRVLLVRARRRAAVATPEESTLLRQINRGIAPELNARYEILADKRDDETLTAAEHQELLEIGNQIEWLGVRRLEALAKLAEIRQVPLRQLMTNLGIHPPEIR